MASTAKPRFGDLVENGWASEENPTRRGFFVREIRNGARRTWEITDGNGKFWRCPLDSDHKLTWAPAAPPPPLEGAAERIKSGDIPEAPGTEAAMVRHCGDLKCFRAQRCMNRDHCGVKAFGLKITREWFEKRVALEGDLEIGAGGLGDYTPSASSKGEALPVVSEEMVETLKPFAEVSAKAKGSDDACWCGQDGAVIRYRDLRRAAALYAALSQREGE